MRVFDQPVHELCAIKNCTVATVAWPALVYRQMVAEADVVAAIRRLVTGVGEITRRVTPLYWSRVAVRQAIPK